MRVVVDVSVLGLAQLFETARTGIYRVISSLVPELLHIDGLDLAVTSLSSTEINQLTFDVFNSCGQGERFVGRNTLEDHLFNAARSLLWIDRKKLVQRCIAKAFRNTRREEVARGTDIFHSTFAPLPGYTKGPQSFLTVYDMIPIIHPEYFWEDFDREFKAILNSVQVERDWILTISESSKKDICEYFGMDRNRVFVAYPAAAKGLYYPETSSHRIEKVLKKYGIPEQGYFLTLATLEFRKNLRTTIEAFKNLLHEPGHADRYLVLVGTKGWKIDQLLDEISGDSLLKDRIIITGYVDDGDLSGIYSGALAFVYPSLYEGFGLPPLEAMRCGLPVITSNSSSLPEVVGDAGIMVVPTDVEGVTQAMLDIAASESLRSSMVDKGLLQAEKFSWSNCAAKTKDAYCVAYETAL